MLLSTASAREYPQKPREGLVHLNRSVAGAGKAIKSGVVVWKITEKFSSDFSRNSSACLRSVMSVTEQQQHSLTVETQQIAVDFHRKNAAVPGPMAGFDGIRSILQQRTPIGGKLFRGCMWD